MTEKVKLTQEQAKAIERYKRELVDSIDEQYRFGVKRTPHEWSEPLVELGGNQVLEIIKHGYEVEPEFEVGDWVYVDWHNGAGVFRVEESKGITTIAGNPALKIYSDGNTLAPIEITRHATPEEIAEEKQRRWWAKHDRKVWELKINDEIRHRDSDKRYDVIRIFENGDINMESTSANDFGQKEVVTVLRSYISNYFYQVVTFAEDRKDLEGEQ